MSGEGSRPRPPTSKLSTLMGERGSRISASSFLWRLASAPSPDASSGAPGIFPVGGGRLMPPPPPGPHSRCPRSGPAASGPSAAPEPPAPGGAPPGPTARLSLRIRVSAPLRGLELSKEPARPGPSGEKQTAASPPLRQIRAARSAPPR